ncbi:bifunctional diguanylate cyclase/phosphodiesterase [Mycolicibacterium sp. P1-5]|uniref:putative bifunctional diguanylate cyclase/phosphodiesterase n=1 Tax=Mycolicibacterium sp. P1-5 TaxID=2024617 RepID=UPI001D15DD6E|nr:bifunctional diguanylate cyclase/phosphodiesterase [Mycolicibacterium sp. P1-5]
MSKMPKTSHVALGAAVAYVAIAAVILAGWSFDKRITVVNDVISVAVTVPAFVFAVLAARSLEGRRRRAWVALTIALLGWASGEAIWAYYDVRFHEVPFPSIADAGYLLFPIGVCAALLFMPVDNRQSRGRLILDGFIVAASLFLVSWVLILHQMYVSDETGRLGLAISVIYPLADILVLTVAAVVVVGAGSDRRLSLTLLTAGAACFALSDSAFVYLAHRDEYTSGNLIDLGWAAGVLLFTVAAAAACDGGVDERGPLALPGWASVWMPYTPLLLAAIVTAAQPAPLLRSPPVMVVAGLLVFAVLARQFLAVRENRRLVAAVADQALHDPLTGLANRALFNSRLDRAMKLLQREQLPLAVISIDLNDFKLVNDNLGHLVGDDLLVGVAARLRTCLRRGDTVARLGGDEFAVLVIGSAEAAELAGNRVVDAFEEPFMLSGHELLIRPSVGLAVAEGHEGALSAGDLMKHADIAMYSAKRSRLRAMQIYTPEMQLLTDVDDKKLFGSPAPDPEFGGVPPVEVLGRLRVAIDNTELTLVYQPKVDLRTGELVGVESLLRWPQPDGGVLSPEAFLPLVRRHGLMGLVTQLVITTALDDALAWHQAGIDVPVAVNLFAPSLANADLPALIARALADRGLEPTALTVEITEDLFLDSTERTRRVLEQLRDNGIRIAIDDFGSGYSALSYLRDLPIDEVKLDRSFISSILVDARAAAVVRAIVDLAHVLDLTVVVEGVEDDETAQLVRELGCDIGQGFFYGLPLAPDELLRSGKTTVSDYQARRRC